MDTIINKETTDRYAAHAMIKVNLDLEVTLRSQTSST